MVAHQSALSLSLGLHVGGNVYGFTRFRTYLLPSFRSLLHVALFSRDTEKEHFPTGFLLSCGPCVEKVMLASLWRWRHIAKEFNFALSPLSPHGHWVSPEKAWKQVTELGHVIVTRCRERKQKSLSQSFSIIRPSSSLPCNNADGWPSWGKLRWMENWSKFCYFPALSESVCHLFFNRNWFQGWVNTLLKGRLHDHLFVYIASYYYSSFNWETI